MSLLLLIRPSRWRHIVIIPVWSLIKSTKRFFTKLAWKVDLYFPTSYQEQTTWTLHFIIICGGRALTVTPSQAKYVCNEIFAIRPLLFGLIWGASSILYCIVADFLKNLKFWWLVYPWLNNWKMETMTPAHTPKKTPKKWSLSTPKTHRKQMGNNEPLSLIFDWFILSLKFEIFFCQSNYHFRCWSVIFSKAQSI